MKKKIISVILTLIAVWLITPFPEVSFLVGILGGSFLSEWFGMSRRMTWVVTICGVLIGNYPVKKFGLLKALKRTED